MSNEGPVPGRWVLACLIGSMCAIELGIDLLGAVSATPFGVRAYVLENGAFWPGLLRNWQPNYALQPWTMFVSYGFLHGGIVHLAVNMLTLWSLGMVVLGRVGPALFALLYLACLVGGAAAFGGLASALQPMVGASGALFGLAGAVLSWDYLDRSAGSDSLWPVARSVAFLVGLNLVLWWAMEGHLAWQTHLGGFVAGWLVALLLYRLGPAR